MIASFLLCDTSLLGYKVRLNWFVSVVSAFCSRSIKYTNVIGVSWHIGVGVSWTVIPSHDINASWNFLTQFIVLCMKKVCWLKKKIVTIMNLTIYKTRIDKSYVNISLPHDNSTGSNKPHTKCQLTPWPMAGVCWHVWHGHVCGNIFEITENDQNIYKPWMGSPDDYLYTGISPMDWIELFYVLWANLWKTCQLTPLSPTVGGLIRHHCFSKI